MYKCVDECTYFHPIIQAEARCIMWCYSVTFEAPRQIYFSSGLNNTKANKSSADSGLHRSSLVSGERPPVRQEAAFFTAVEPHSRWAGVRLNHAEHSQQTRLSGGGTKPRVWVKTDEPPTSQVLKRLVLSLSLNSPLLFIPVK